MRTRSFLVALGLLFAVPCWAANFTVTANGVQFSPRNLTIQAGDSVTFRNGGGFHNVVADNGSFRCAVGCDGAGGSGEPSNTSWAVVVQFDEPGTVGYKCEVHAGMGMTGTITVEPPATPAFSLNQQGLTGSWANPATDSQGLLLTVFPNLVAPGRGSLFAGWFTYDVSAAGGHRWYTVQGDVSADDDSATLPIYRTVGGAFDTGQATTTTEVGEAVVHFDDCSHGSLHYTFADGSGRDGTIPLTRLLPNVNCTSNGVNTGGGAYLRSGAWADMSNGGQGLVMDVNPPLGVFFAAWYTFFAEAAADAGGAGQHWYTLQAAIPSTFTTLQDAGIFETAGGVFDQPATTTNVPVGTATITWHTCSTATMDYAFTAGANAGISGTLDLVRIGPEPQGCTL